MRAKVTSDGTSAKTRVSLVPEGGPEYDISALVQGVTWNITDKGPAIMHLSLAPLNEAVIWAEVPDHILEGLQSRLGLELDRRKTKAKWASKAGA